MMISKKSWKFEGIIKKKQSAGCVTKLISYSQKLTRKLRETNRLERDKYLGCRCWITPHEKFSEEQDKTTSTNCKTDSLP